MHHGSCLLSRLIWVEREKEDDDEAMLMIHERLYLVPQDCFVHQAPGSCHVVVSGDVRLGGGGIMGYICGSHSPTFYTLPNMRP